MTLYETLFVVHPERGSRMKEFIEKFKKVIEGQEGTVSLVDEWGMRDLAYRIEKQSKGVYALLRYQATGPRGRGIGAQPQADRWYPALFNRSD